MSISVNSISYTHPDREILFQTVSLSLSKDEKAALVGHNGVGKSTLLQIIAGDFAPSSGEVTLPEKPYYVPQHLGQYDNFTVAEVLGVAPKLTALRAILEGDVTPEHFAVLNEEWDIEERVQAALSYWNMQHIPLFQTLKSLSGGEKTKVFLAGAQINSPGIMLLDEPSNHLDSESRQLLYAFIKKVPATILLVSHDRTLLNQMDTTFELTKLGIEAFGGNYDFYKEQKEGKLNALQFQLEDREKMLRQAREKAREVAGQRQKKEARGKAEGKRQSLPRIIAGGRKTQAEQSTVKIMDVHNERINEVNEHLKKIRSQIQDYQVLKIDIRKSNLHQGKILIEAQDINFGYDNDLLWRNPLNFQLRSGDRLRVEGKNGSGKTTLVKLITGSLAPSSGRMYTGDFECLYIDQEYSMIDPQFSVFEQVQRFNVRHLPESELKTWLHYHQFPREMWDRKSGGLSGGEKMKLALCCIAISNNMPDLLVLDEPTNNLDIQSQEVLTHAVKNFNGSLLVISHDEYFIKEIGIDQHVRLM